MLRFTRPPDGDVNGTAIVIRKNSPGGTPGDLRRRVRAVCRRRFAKQREEYGLGHADAAFEFFALQKSLVFRGCP